MEKLEELLNNNPDNLDVSQVMNVIREKVQKQREGIDYYFKPCLDIIKLISREDETKEINDNLQFANLNFNTRHKPDSAQITEVVELHANLHKSLSKINRWFYDYPLTDKSFKSRLRKILKKTIRPFLLYQNVFNVQFTRLLNNLVRLYDQEIPGNINYNAHIVRTLNSLVSKMFKADQIFIEWAEDLSRSLYLFVEKNKGELFEEIERRAKEFEEYIHESQKQFEELYKNVTENNKSIEDTHKAINEILTLKNTQIESIHNLLTSHNEDIFKLQRRLDKVSFDVDKEIDERIKEYRNIQLTIKSIKNELSEFQARRQGLISTSPLGKPEQKKQDNIIDSYGIVPNFDFYAFEEWARGSEESVVSQQEDYVKFFVGKERILDIGCGRGEFLELLRKEGINSYGIDADINMVAHCKEKGLEVFQADALSYLKSLNDNSLGGIFAGQLIEHLSTSDLIILIELAYDKLKSDSLIILETVNPTNLTTFSGSFYADPTHIKPVHPVTLEFFMEKAGFRDINIHYSVPFPEEGKLNEFDIPDTIMDHTGKFFQLYNQNVRKLNQLLFGYANYAMIAYK